VAAGIGSQFGSVIGELPGCGQLFRGDFLVFYRNNLFSGDNPPPLINGHSICSRPKKQPPVISFD